MQSQIYDSLVNAKLAGRKMLAVLIDPDHLEQIETSVAICNAKGVDILFLGGSLVSSGTIGEAIERIKKVSEIPVVLFPGDELQIDGRADALLLLSLISGRNPELLIGKHVVAAPYIKRSGLEAISTGYMLVDGGRLTTASYMSGTLPIPADKPEIAQCTAIAGELLGLKLMYLDAGSGAQKPVSSEMIKAVSKSIEVPLVVGGGIRTAADAANAWLSGADIVVVGNAVEKDAQLITELTNALQQLQAL